MQVSDLLTMFAAFIALGVFSAAISLHRIALALEGMLETRNWPVQITLIADEEEKEETK